MTFKEKVMKMITTCDEQTLINNVCPYEIGLESEEAAEYCNGRCIDCWNR